ncbi:MAG: S8 family peptidase [Burkholderiales bacterium]|nr:S8 family peptidase [Burkholderiales bacterium]
MAIIESIDRGVPFLMVVMRPVRPWLLVLTWMLLALAPGASAREPLRLTPSQAAAMAAREDQRLGARVIVQYKAQASLLQATQGPVGPQAAGGPQRAVPRGPQHAASLARRLGLSLSDGRAIDRRTQVLHGARGISSAALAARLAADPDVAYAVPDRRRRALAVPNDPLFAAGNGQSPAAGQWYLRAPDATLVSAINAVAAWNLHAGSASTVVAVLDTGVQAAHPDLAAKLHPGYDFIHDLPTAADGDGRDPDPADPGDWTGSNECDDGYPAQDSSWHGTQTAGLIGAHTGNGIGMASVGNQVMLLPVRVLGKCGGWDSDIIAGMLWAGGVSELPVPNPHPARVLNLSLGGPGACGAAYADAVSQLAAAGVVVVAAAGNDTGFAVNVPANCPGVIAVAGVRHAGTKVGYSNLGPEVALAAPAGNCVNDFGECLYPILTTTNSGRRSPLSHAYSDGYRYSVGTSFAAPLVAGTAGLMLSANPALTPDQLRQLLTGSARPFPIASSDPTVPACREPDDRSEQLECLCTSATCGAGLLDAASAVAAATAWPMPSAAISGLGTTVPAGTPLMASSAGSGAPQGRAVVGYEWAITQGGALASISGEASGPTVRITTFAAGSFTLQLRVTDSMGLQAAVSRSVTLLAGDADRVFNWAEAAYPQHFPGPGVPGQQAPYTYRHYPTTGNYIGVANGRVVLHNGRDWQLLDVGALADLLARAAAAGY